MTIHILSTGGTIDKEYTLSGDLGIGEAMVREVLSAAHTDVEFTFETVFQKDSLDLVDEDRLRIRERALAAPSNLVLITHGTDTMAETAECLKDIPDKVIVLTGAMTPARMVHTDAAFNIGLAVGALQLLPAGVYVAMSARVFSAGEVVKDRGRGVFVSSDGMQS